MTEQINAKLAHPQLPATAKEWANYSHNLHAVLKDKYAIDLKAGKIFHALSQAANFTNSHDLSKQLGEFEQAIFDSNQAFQLQQTESRNLHTKHQKIVSFMLLSQQFSGEEGMKHHKALVYKLLFSEPLASLSLDLLKKDLYQFIYSSDAAIEDLVIELSSSISNVMNEEMVGFVEAIFPEYSQSAIEATNTQKGLDASDHQNAYRLELTRIVAQQLSTRVAIKLRDFFDNTEAEHMMDNPDTEQNIKMAIDTSVEAGIINFITMASRRAMAKAKTMEDGA